ncbi:hypothetical protein GVAV_001019 [Gurleya vavrai]
MDAFFEWYFQDAESQRKNKNFTPEDFSKEHLINVNNESTTYQKKRTNLPNFLKYLAPIEKDAVNRPKDLILYTFENNNKVLKFNIDIFKHFKRYQALNQYTIKFEINFIYQLIIKNLDDDKNDFLIKKNKYNEQNLIYQLLFKNLNDEKNDFLIEKNKYNEQNYNKSMGKCNTNKKNGINKVSAFIHMDVVDDLDQQNDIYNLQNKKHLTETSTKNTIPMNLNQHQQNDNQKITSLIKDDIKILKTENNLLPAKPNEQPKINVGVFYTSFNSVNHLNEICSFFFCIFVHKRNFKLSDEGICKYKHKKIRRIKYLINLYYNDEIIINAILKKESFNYEQIKDIDIYILFEYFEDIFKLAVDQNTGKDRQLTEANVIIENIGNTHRIDKCHFVKSGILIYYKEKRKEIIDLIQKNQAASLDPKRN